MLQVSGERSASRAIRPVVATEPSWSPLLGTSWSGDVTRALLEQLRRHHAPTASHSIRVMRLAIAMWARSPDRLGEAETVLVAGALHDIGKLFVPASTLDSSRPLDAAERDAMRRHPEAGASVLQKLGFSSHVVDAVRDHHERWLGGGYPSGRRGEETHPLARTIAVVDAYAAMVEPGRHYRKRLTGQAALQEIMACRGTQFDPASADLLASVIAERGAHFAEACGS